MDELRRRTRGERAAYLDGFEAGAKAALEQVCRLNFREIADRAYPNIMLSLLAASSVAELEDERPVS